MRYLRTGIATIALCSIIVPAFAADKCATEAEVTALKIAMVQQEFMVAALACYDVDAYNRFVLINRDELRRSDADLKGFFERRGGEHGEADYDSFKTKLANISALKDTRNSAAFCANTQTEFQAAFQRDNALASFVAAKTLPFAMAEVCSLPTLETRSEPVPTKVAEASHSDVSVEGVPPYEMPANPYGGGQAAADAPHPAPPPTPPPPAYMDYASRYLYAPPWGYFRGYPLPP